MKHSQFYFHKDSISCKSFVPQKLPAIATVCSYNLSYLGIIGESKNLGGSLPLKYTMDLATWIRMRMEYCCWLKYLNSIRNYHRAIATVYASNDEAI